MRTAPVLVAFGLAASVVSSPAQGDERARPSVGMTWAAPALRSLPEGRVAPKPDTRPPARIPAREKVDGFVLAPPQIQSKASQSVIQARLAKRAPNVTTARRGISVLSSGGSPTTGEGATALCFAQGALAPPASDPVEADDDDLTQEQKKESTARSRQWPEQVSSTLSLSFYPDAKPIDSIRAVHAERFVPGKDGHASVEVTDAWVDLQTTGVRAIAHYELPLVRVLFGPNGLEVFAARDRDAVQVVVRAPSGFGEQTPELAEQVRAELRSLDVKLSGDSEATSDCGHLRFALQAARGAAEMATLESVALLPPLRKPEFTDEDGDVAAQEEAARALRAMRRRPFRLAISVTQSLSDQEPLFSLTLGWNGRDQQGTSTVSGDD